MANHKLMNQKWAVLTGGIDHATHRIGQCSECLELICVKKVRGPRANREERTTEMLQQAFRKHVKTMHSQ